MLSHLSRYLACIEKYQSVEECKVDYLWSDKLGTGGMQNGAKRFGKTPAGILRMCNLLVSTIESDK